MPSLKFISNRLFNHFIKKPIHIWLFLIGLIFALSFPLIFKPNPSLHIKMSGYVLQLLFLGILAWDLIHIRNLNEIKPFSSHFVEWVKEIPKLFKKRSVTVSIEPLKMNMTMGDVTLTTSDKERIELLKKNQKKLSNRVKELENKLNSETKSLKDMINDTLKEMRSVGLSYQWIALYYLAIGLLFRTFSNEIATIL